MTMFADHVQVNTPADALSWLAAVALWLAGVALHIYRKLSATR